MQENVPSGICPSNEGYQLYAYGRARDIPFCLKVSRKKLFLPNISQNLRYSMRRVLNFATHLQIKDGNENSRTK